MTAAHTLVGAVSLVVNLPQPYLLFLGDTTVIGYAKTALGLKDWVPERCVGELALPAATVSAGLPRLTPAQARELMAAASARLGLPVADPILGGTEFKRLLDACLKEVP